MRPIRFTIDLRILDMTPAPALAAGPGFSVSAER